MATHLSSAVISIGVNTDEVIDTARIIAKHLNNLADELSSETVKPDR